ncbi:hypothetical protein ACWIUD_08705 [Helicobacter sp. 23-1044]
MQKTQNLNAESNVKSQNLNVDCHKNSCEFSRNDEIIADSANRTSNCHIERSEISQNRDSSLTSFAQNDKNILPLSCGGGLRGWVNSTKSTNCHTERSEVSLFRFCDSALVSPNFTLKSLIFSQKGLHPRSAPPDYLIVSPKSSRFFAFRGRASLNPLLAKNRHSHYCSFAPDFLHHEAGEIKGASHGFLLDSAIRAKNAESNTKSQNLNVDCHENSCEFSRNDEIIADSVKQIQIAKSNSFVIWLPRYARKSYGLSEAKNLKKIDSAIHKISRKFAESTPNSANLKAG